jgi:hypothetical protein
MTAPLRRWHLRVWLLIMVVAPLVFVAALLARRPTTPSNPGITWERGK